MNALSPDGASLVVLVPRVHTARLLLREFRASDFDAYAGNVADPEVTRFISGATDRRTAWRLFSTGAAGWILHGKGWWIVEVAETGEAIGTAGAFVREGKPDIELGWSLYRRFWGHGYATEAAKAALDFAFDRHHARRVIAHISPGNAASVRVSQKLGMIYETDVDLYGTRVGRYAASAEKNFV
jgi:RimJ/RimL family protein N-acetyltransferase